MLDNLFVAAAVAAVGEALASAHANEGTVAVIGNARLAGALAKQRTTLAVGLSARAAKKIAELTGLPFKSHPNKFAALASQGWRSLAIPNANGLGANRTRWIASASTWRNFWRRNCIAV